MNIKEKFKNKSKGKLTVIIALGIISLILTLTIFMQFKTVKQTDITAIETMRETELREELAGWKAKYEEVQTKLSDTEEKINSYKNEMANEEASNNLINQEYIDTENYLGYTDVEGEGIIINIDSTDEKQVASENILTLINELRLAGAEAISINDERVVNTTEIVDVDTRFVIVNEKRLVGPFVIKAIGDKKYLESSISIKGGYLDQMKANEINVTYSLEDKIQIPKYSGVYNLEYVVEK